jgi:GntR family transcriptional repressor for pyruvate dehydrogenase complex
MADTNSNEGLTFAPVRALSASLAAVREVQRMISTGQLRPGDQLPSERELALQLHISRPTLREAIRALRLLGQVDTQHGRGTFVAETAVVNREGSSSQANELAPQFDTAQVLEMRAVIESGLARLAAGRITPKALERFETIVDQMDGVFDKHDLLRLDIELHDLVAEVSGNAPLIGYLASVRPLISVARSRTMEAPEVRSRIESDQRRLLAALKAGDPEEASRAMWNHLMGVFATYSGTSAHIEG